MMTRCGLTIMILVALTAMSPASKAEPTSAQVCRGLGAEVLPSGCCNEIPPDAPEPYVPGALMHPDDNHQIVTLKTCIMWKHLPPDGQVLELVGQWGFFAPDAKTGAGHLVSLGGQGPNSNRRLPGPAAKGFLSIPIESDSFVVVAGALPLITRNVVLIVRYQGPTDGDWTKRSWQSIATTIVAEPY